MNAPEILTAVDQCGTATVTFNEVRTNGNCPNRYTLRRTWTATDACGNTISRVLIINVRDTTPPTFTAPPNITLQCNQNPNNLNLTGDVTDENDNCSTNLQANYTDTVVQNTCNRIITRVWTLSDECGNTTSHSQTITVQDTTAPTFVQTIPANVTVECNAIPAPATITATDACDTNPIVVTLTETTTAGSCPSNYVITRTWRAIDRCGNLATASQTITVQDTTAPTFVQTIPANVTVECNAIPAPATITATDACDTNPIV
ncbi:MAG: gliding motility-associated C-terminal domain-containing protein, partial [Flavobacterium sp.]|nr:gliding motility-associated C-terminal domain-containing protein [Flavobacterium sp.]